MAWIRLLTIVGFGCLMLRAVPAVSQDVPLATEMPVPGLTGYAAEIPKPEDVVGHVIGTAHTTPAQITAYFRAVARVSDRVLVEEHGQTYERRPLLHAIVTSPANHERLEAIRAANLRLSDAPEDVEDALLAGMPAVVYMGYSIHGNEASGAEAAVLMLYHLAAGRGPAVEEALDSVIVILDPMFNPDGRDRFTNWVNRNRGAVPTTDGQDREHNEPWPGGRTNHYWFDLNRDWLPLEHPESQGRVALFHAWRPQVLTDHHEMGGDATFFFQPGIPSRTNENTPQRNQDLTAEIATYHAAALDRIGQFYYSEEGFDDFYLGKGSAYPDVHGSIGILFEQASSRALSSETDNGVLDYAVTIRNQFATSLSTLEAVRRMRTKLLRYQRDFYREAPDVARRAPVQGYVVSLEGDRTRAQLLGRLLQRHRVRVHALSRDVTVDGRSFRAGSAYVVPLQQPQARFVKSVMERVTSFQDSLFYDVSTWTLPLAYGVTHAEVRDASGLVGDALEAMAPDGGQVVGGRSSYAYLMPWGRYYAPRALYRLQRAGVRTYVMHEPFSATVGDEVHPFERGTLVIPVARQEADPDVIHALVEQLAAEEHVTFFGVETGLTPTGPELGSPSRSVLEPPVVALLTGPGTSSGNAGEIWHLLSERFRMPVSLVDADGSIDWSRYTTVVLAGGSYGALDAEALKAWVRRGGHLIAMTSGASWTVRQGFTELSERPFDVDSLLREVPYADLDEARGAQVIGGAVFEARLDRTHPLAYGLSGRLPLFVRFRSTVYDPSSTPGTNVAVLTEAPLLSGYLAEEQAERMAGSAAVVAHRFGRGRVTLFMDDPNFRSFWYGTSVLFLNAVFLGKSY